VLDYLLLLYLFSEGLHRAEIY